jgi:hypothetical protein
MKKLTAAVLILALILHGVGCALLYILPASRHSPRPPLP